MSKSSIFLVLLLLFAIGSYFYIKSTPTQTQTLITNLANKYIATPSPSSTAGIALTASPVRAGATFDVFVKITSANIEAGLLQVEVGYDPAALTPISVAPGDYFKNPKVLLQNINQHTGRISFALKCLPTSPTDPCIMQKDQPATIISFSINSLAPNNATIVELLPKTLLKTNDEKAIPFTISGTTITLPGSSTTASQGALLQNKR